MELISTEPVIIVDIARHRFRIHRTTLERLGKPDYVRLLINPDKKGLVVASCNEDTQGAHRLRHPSKRHSTEVYSPSLVNELAKCAGFAHQKAVRLTGRQLRGQQVIFFSLENAGDADERTGVDANE